MVVQVREACERLGVDLGRRPAHDLAERVDREGNVRPGHCRGVHQAADERLELFGERGVGADDVGLVERRLEVLLELGRVGRRARAVVEQVGGRDA